MKYAIYEGNLDRLEKKLKRIFNKCKAYGCDFHYEQTGEEFRELKDEKGNKYTARFVLVEAEGTAVINDWEFVAELEHTEKGNIITGVAGIEQILEFPTKLEYLAYMESLKKGRSQKFKETSFEQLESGVVRITIRKQYNNNAFPDDEKEGEK